MHGSKIAVAATFGVLCLLNSSARAATLSISSTPSGATVEINGLITGKTPYTVQYPGGYFHKTHTVFGSRLEHPIVVRISMDGYASQQITVTEGPFTWHSFNGRSEGNYWLIKTDHFQAILEPIARIFTGEPEIHSAKADANEPPRLSRFKPLPLARIPRLCAWRGISSAARAFSSRTRA